MDRGAPAHHRERAARFPARRRRVAAGRARAAAGAARTRITDRHALCRKCARRHRRLCAVSGRCGHAGGCPGGRAGAVSRGGARRPAGRLQDQLARTELPAGLAVCARPQLARTPVPRLHHARLGVRSCPVGQHAADPGAAESAPGTCRPAGLPQFRGALAGAQDGSVGRGSRSFSARPGAPCAASGATRYDRPGPVRSPRARVARTEAVGHFVRGRTAQAGALRLFGAGTEALLPGAARARWPVRADRTPVLGPHPRRPSAGLGAGGAVLPD